MPTAGGRSGNEMKSFQPINGSAGARVLMTGARFFQKTTALFILMLLFGCASQPVLPGTVIVPFEDRQVEQAWVKHDGSDTVVFENGLGATMDTWEKVFSSLANDTTTFAYNRPGYGKSAEAQTPRDGIHIVEELRSLLRSKGLNPPYILVGHSLGGLYLQLFARRHPEEVKALVLVDSTHPRQFMGSGSPEHWPVWLKFGFWLWMSRTNEKEFNGINKTGEDLLALPTLTGKPVIVLTALNTPKAAPESAGVPPTAETPRSPLAQLYPGSKQEWVFSGHDIPRQKPERIISLIREALSGNGKP